MSNTGERSEPSSAIGWGGVWCGLGGTERGDAFEEARRLKPRGGEAASARASGPSAREQTPQRSEERRVCRATRTRRGFHRISLVRPLLFGLSRLDSLVQTDRKPHLAWLGRLAALLASLRCLLRRPSPSEVPLSVHPDSRRGPHASPADSLTPFAHPSRGAVSSRETRQRAPVTTLDQHDNSITRTRSTAHLDRPSPRRRRGAAR